MALESGAHPHQAVTFQPYEKRKGDGGALSPFMITFPQAPQALTQQTLTKSSILGKS